MEERSEVQTSFASDCEVSGLYKLYVKIIILSMLTFGIYGFWGITNLRKYLYGSVSLRDSRFYYHGTGKELFLGFLIFNIATFVYFLCVIGLGVVIAMPEILPLMATYTVFVMILTLILFFAAQYRSIQYLASRVSWKGVRFSLLGSTIEFGKKVTLYLFLYIITLSLSAPSSNLKIVQYIVNNSRFGNRSFNFNYDHHDLFWKNIVSLLLAIPTLGYSRLLYAAHVRKFIVAHISHEELTLIDSATKRQIAWLYFSNLLLIIITFGLAIPYAMVRSLRFNIEHIKIVGNIDEIKWEASSNVDVPRFDISGGS